MNNIYVTYMSNDRDILGVLVLNYRLKVLKSKYDLSCMVTHDVSLNSRKLLEKFGIKIINIDFFENFEKFNIDKDKLNSLYKKHTFGKLFIFLINTKCVYLDSDFYINKNIDHLFEYDTSNKQIYMTNDLLMRQVESSNNFELLNINNEFNSGLIIFQGDESIFIETVKFILLTPYDDLDKWYGDQTVLNYLFKNKSLNVKTLDHKYNLIFHSIDFFIENNIIDEEDIYVIHYILSDKPWLVDSLLNKCGDNYSKKYWLKWFEAYHDLQENSFNKNNLNFKNISYINK